MGHNRMVQLRKVCNHPFLFCFSSFTRKHTCESESSAFCPRIPLPAHNNFAFSVPVSVAAVAVRKVDSNPGSFMWLYRRVVCFVLYVCVCQADESLVRCCGKFAMLDVLLPALKAAQHRVLVFSQMTKLLDLLEVRFFSFLLIAMCFWALLLVLIFFLSCSSSPSF